VGFLNPGSWATFARRFKSTFPTYMHYGRFLRNHIILLYLSFQTCNINAVACMYNGVLCGQIFHCFYALWRNIWKRKIQDPRNIQHFYQVCIECSYVSDIYTKTVCTSVGSTNVKMLCWMVIFLPEKNKRKLDVSSKGPSSRVSYL
jgi:hypothetical protein